MLATVDDGSDLALSGLSQDMVHWRRHFHRHPELAFSEHETSAFIVARLREFGIEDIATNVGGTGVVASLRSGRSERAIALRADMDALPITERGDHDHVSTRAGIMHGCGHDGHTAMLLGAAKHLAATRHFDGIVRFIFQPAEETLEAGSAEGAGPGGANAMMADGLFERFPVDAIFGVHNRPGIAAGRLAGRHGAMFAAVDRFEIIVHGKGGHAARPHLCVDPILVASHIVIALQSIVAREIDPLDPCVLSACEFHGGTAFNVVPDRARVSGTVRTLGPAARARVEQALNRIATEVAHGMGARAEVRFHRGHPALVNEPGLYRRVRDICILTFGEQAFLDLDHPSMGGEDFSNYLRERPGCFILLGNGLGEHGGTMLHHPCYDFNDDAAPVGAAFWIALTQGLLSVPGEDRAIG